MMRLPVASSRIRSIGYDRASHRLEIEFPDASVYTYYGVPHETYIELITAASIGRFFDARIKGAYDYERT